MSEGVIETSVSEVVTPETDTKVVEVEDKKAPSSKKGEEETDDEDFDLGDIEDEDIPDFLKGEDVKVIK